MTNTADNYGNFDRQGRHRADLPLGHRHRRRVLGRLLLPEQRQRHQLRPALAAPGRLGRRSASNPGGLMKIDPKNYYGAASDYSAGDATTAPSHYTHRFKDGGELAHRAAQRRLRPRPARQRRSASACADQRAGRRQQPRLHRRSRRARRPVATRPPLTRGTQQQGAGHGRDLPADRLHATRFDWFGRKNEVLAGIDLAREEFNNYTWSCRPAWCSTRTTRARRSARRTTAPRSTRRLRQKVKTRNFVAKALGVYAQDLIQVAPDWKLLAGLRWDRFEGDYVSPPTGANPRARAGAVGFAVEPALRRALPAEPSDALLRLLRHVVQHLGRALQLRRPGLEHAAREEPQHRGRRQARPVRGPPLGPRRRSSIRPSTTSATATRPTASRSRTTCCRASATPPASRSTWPAASRRPGRCSPPTRGSRAPRSTRPARAAP